MRKVLSFSLLVLLLILPICFGQDRAIRRPLYTSAAFSPTDLSGLVLWNKADSLALSDNDPVTTWNDSSASANDCTQSGTVEKPTYKTGILNGKPIVRFDGVNDRLVMGTEISLSTSTAFIVCNRTNSAGAGYKFVFSIDQYAIATALSGVDQWGLYTSGDVTSGAATNSTFRTLGVTYRSSSDIDLVTNGSKVTVSGGAGGSGSSSIGNYYVSGLFFTGDVAEVILYNSALSDSDRGQVETYLRTKYGHY